MTDKGFNLFDECAARYVHKFPREEECTSFSFGGSKRYTSSSIANSQRMLTEINESGVNQKKDLSGKCHCQTYKSKPILTGV